MGRASVDGSSVWGGRERGLRGNSNGVARASAEDSGVWGGGERWKCVGWREMAWREREWKAAARCLYGSAYMHLRGRIRRQRVRERE